MFFPDQPFDVRGAIAEFALFDRGAGEPAPVAGKLRPVNAFLIMIDKILHRCHSSTSNVGK
jgi:hypothetical protein